MRILIVLAICLSLATILAGSIFIDPSLLKPRVTFSGLNNLEEVDLVSSIPPDTSIFTWYFAKEVIQAKLKANPKVDSVDIENCNSNQGWFSRLLCFNVDVNESVGRFVLLGSKRGTWVLSTTGNFLYSLRRVSSLDSNLIPLSGEHLNEISQTSLAPLVREVNELVAAVGSLEGLRVRRITVNREDECELILSPGDTKVIFQIGGDGQTAFNVQAHRLKLILEQSERMGRMPKSVDLAYSKIGVASY